MKRTLMILSLGLIGIAYAAERLEFPGESEGPPYYSRQQVVGEDWVAIPWTKTPESTPKNANLLTFDFDAQGNPLVIHGYAIRSSATGAPDVLHAEGNEDMPIWFVSREDWDDLVADGDVTKQELEKADSLLKGTADNFVMHLENPDASLLTISAVGSLPDGGTFNVQYSRVDGELKTSKVTLD